MDIRRLIFFFFLCETLAFGRAGDFHVIDAQMIQEEVQTFEKCQKECVAELESTFKRLAKESKLHNTLATPRLKALEKLRSKFPLDAAQFEALLREISGDKLVLLEADTMGYHLARIIHNLVTLTFIRGKPAVDPKLHYVAGRGLFHYIAGGDTELKTFRSLAGDSSPKLVSEATEMISRTKEIKKAMESEVGLE